MTTVTAATTLVRDPAAAAAQHNLPPNLQPWFLGTNSLKEAVAAFEASPSMNGQGLGTVVSYDLKPRQGSKIYHVAPDIAAFDLAVQTTVLDPRHRNAYEVLLEGQRVKPYFDLEYISTAVTPAQLDAARRDFITLLTLLKANLQRACAALLGVTSPTLMFLDGSRQTSIELKRAHKIGVHDALLAHGAVANGQQLPCHKFSCHIIIDGLAFEYATHPAMRFFVERAIPAHTMHELAPHLLWLPAANTQPVPDMKVYGKCQNFRMLGSCKRGTDVPLTLMESLSTASTRAACLVTLVAGLPTARVGSTAFVSEPAAAMLPAAAAAVARSGVIQPSPPAHAPQQPPRKKARLGGVGVAVSSADGNDDHDHEHKLQQLQRAAQRVLRSYGDVSTDVQCLAEVDGESLRFQCNHYGKGRFCLISKTEHFDNNCLLFAEPVAASAPNNARKIQDAYLIKYNCPSPSCCTRAVLAELTWCAAARTYGGSLFHPPRLLKDPATAAVRRCPLPGAVFAREAAAAVAARRPIVVPLLMLPAAAAAADGAKEKNDGNARGGGAAAAAAAAKNDKARLPDTSPAPLAAAAGVGVAAVGVSRGQHDVGSGGQGPLPHDHGDTAGVGGRGNHGDFGHAAGRDAPGPHAALPHGGGGGGGGDDDGDGGGDGGGGDGDDGTDAGDDGPAEADGDAVMMMPPPPDDEGGDSGDGDNDGGGDDDGDGGDDGGGGGGGAADGDDDDDDEDTTETYDYINPNPADDSDNYYPMVKRRFERYVFQTDHPVGYAFLGYRQYDRHIQHLKRVELANHFESAYFVDPDTLSQTDGKPERKPFVTTWLKDPRKKKKLEIVYVPGQAPPHVYNSWGGFYADRLPAVPRDQVEALVAPIVAHIRQVIANGKEEDLLFVLKWLAQIVKYPDSKTQVAMFLYGTEGCGKNLVFDLMQNVLGAPNGFQTSSPERDVFGTFTTAFDKAVLIQCDEIKRSHDYESLFKDYVTGETVRSEAKGKDAKTVKNRVNFIFTSNTEGVFSISPFDRRCVLFNCSSCFVGNEAYFKFLQNYRRQPDVIRAFYQYLRDMVDLPENYQFQFNRPKTEFYRDQQKLCIRPLEQFLSSVIVEYEANRLLSFRMGLTALKFKQSSLWKLFQKFLEASKEVFEGKQNSFTKCLLKKKGVKLLKESIATSYVLDVPVLKADMILNRVFDEDAAWLVE